MDANAPVAGYWMVVVNPYPFMQHDSAKMALFRQR